MGHSVAILGASGYAGGELIRLVEGHPDLELVYLGAHSRAGSRLGEVHPQLPWGERLLHPIDAVAIAGVDLTFLSLPHGASAELGVRIVQQGGKVVDLGSDFRMDTPERYAEAYPDAHPHPDELGKWAYGLPELFRDTIVGTAATAVPGCYPTSALLALAPLVAEGVIEPVGVVVDSISGTSGAGRSAKPELSFGAIAEGVRAYAIGTHRHRPEMERGIEAFAGRSATLVFTPRLGPMQRGILTTCYARLAGDPDSALLTLEKTYAGEPFVAVIDEPPQTRWVTGSNRCLLFVHVDERTGTVIVLSAIDNLMKGAAGQAVQCANLMLGLAEDVALPLVGAMP